jgi:murein DD-endopeptidase MepM/ murein hydrolase activator NlpD
VASDLQRIVAAAQRYGPTVDRIAHRYTNPVTGKALSGTALLLKVMQGESGALSNPGAARTKVSDKGARGWTQFMPSSRATAIKQYGVDPWRSPEEAVHAAALHLRGKINGSTGLEGYNPGSSTYPSYILGQRVGQYLRGVPRTVAGGGGGGGGGGGASVVTGSQASAFSGQGGQLAAMLAALTTPGKPRIQSSLPTVPDFAAQTVVPKGFQVPDAGVVQPAAAVLDQATAAQLAAAAAGDQQNLTVPTYSVTGGGGGGARGPYTPGKQIQGAIHYSPIPGAEPHAATHPTGNLPGYPAFDYMAPAGTRVVAPVNGKVVKLSGKDPKLGGPPGGALGYSVYIKGDNGNTYFLTHMDRIGVKVGQRIRRGTQIAVVANGPASWSSPHVHMGVHRG